jgi:signal transduction histidine kinase
MLERYTASTPERTARVAVAYIDTAGRITHANESFAQLSGQPVQAMRPFTDLIFHSDRRIVQDSLEQMKRGSVNSIVRRVRLAHPHRPLWCRLDLSRAPASSDSAAVAVVRAHNGMRGAAGEGPRVRHRAVERDLRRALKDRDEFLKVFAHELRGPLNAIRGWTTLMQSHRVEPNRIPHAVEIIERNAASIATLVDDLSSLAHVQPTSSPRERVDLRSVVNAIVESVFPAAEQRELTLTVRHTEVLPIRAEVVRIEQVVRNLLLNAIKFTPGGGRIEVNTKRVGDRAELTVRDTGIGIGAELLPSIFKPFQQGPQPHAEGSFGLGLAIVKDLVQQHHGDVYATSPGPGQGTSFVVTLPLADSGPLTQAAA